ncbi:MAG: PEP-CTERM sorting domain-containing protein [Desulfobacterium sp.]|nr:PEP-CTERM sorting domain-containing protein [Desulfobacterium sp.]
MRKLLMVFCLVMISSVAQAAPYDFKGTMVDVDAWTGSGTNETILVIDWNRLDYGDATLHESHAFGYRWDGVKTEQNMLQDFHDAGIFAMTTGYGGGFLMNLAYYDGTDEVHMHVEEGSWNLASTSNPNARWGTWGDSEWDFNKGGTNAEMIADGQFEGINAVMYYGVLPSYADDQLDIPFATPVPAAIWLLGFGLLGLVGLRRKNG